MLKTSRDMTRASGNEHWLEVIQRVLSMDQRTVILDEGRLKIPGITNRSGGMLADWHDWDENTSEHAAICSC